MCPCVAAKCSFFHFTSVNGTNAWVAAEETDTEKPAPKITITKNVTPQPSSDSQTNKDGESSASRLLTGLSLGAATAVLGSVLLF